MITRDHASTVWRSIRTTFILFLVLVPVVVLANISRAEAGDPSQLILRAAGLVIFAAILAEISRRTINFFAGATVCQWRRRS